MNLDKYNLINPWSDDRIFYFIDFNRYAMVYGKAWTLPYDFKINYCIN